MKTKGIDVSQWQETINWANVKSQIDFVILREGYRKAVDKRFFEYVGGCKANQIPIHGVYHFIYATDNQGVLEEAESCLSNVEKAGLGKDIIVWADFEYDTVNQAKKKGIVLGKAECELFTTTFCDFFSKRGYQTGIYCNLDYYKNMYSQTTLDKYLIWLADYTGDADKPCLYHQYSSTGKIDGIRGNVDSNYYFGESEELDDGSETMTKTESAIRWMEEHAKDNSHGYDQRYRWGEKGDYDCSSAVITAWQTAGIPVKTAGATYTGNMYRVFLANGFKDVTASVNLSTGAGMKRGDVLLNHVHHVAMYCGNGKEVEASINEKGKATGGQPGDQTGKEFLVRSYRNYPWNCVLRYIEEEETLDAGTTDGVNGNDLIKAGQIHSINFTGSIIEADGISGKETAKQKVRVLQTALNLDYNAKLVVDGEYGNKTRSALGTHYVKKGEKQYMVTACEILLYMNGYNPEGVESPGIFGNGCMEAVKLFQEDHVISPTGVCNAATFYALIGK